MTPWLIQQHDEDTADLVAALKKLGVEHHIAEYNPLRFDHGGLENAVIYGTIEFVRQPTTPRFARRFYNWFTLDNFKCSVYYPTLGNLHINYDCIFLPFGMVGEDMRLLQYVSGGGLNSVFIRPDSGLKLFPADTYLTHNTLFRQKWDGVKTIATANPESMCVITSPKYITHEWRFFVVDGIVSTGSSYMVDGKVDFVPIQNTRQDERAFRYAQTVATTLHDNKTDPEEVYTLDVCADGNGEMWVLELNAFNCSGLYACDKEKLVLDIEAFISRESS